MAIAAHDITPDSPTNTFATLNNSLQHDATTSAVSDGNLKWNEPSSSAAQSDMPNSIANISAVSGEKWYWEVVIFGDSNQRIASFIGVILQQDNTKGNALYSIADYFNGTCYAWGNDTNNTTNTSSTDVYQRNGNTLNQVSPAQASYLVHGTVVGVLLDLESSPNTVTLYQNGSELADRGGITTKMTLDASSEFFPFFGCGTTSGTQIHLVNFGQDPTFGGNKTSGSANATDANGYGSFYYQPPTGALALCTANLPDPDIDPKVDDLPEDYFKAVEYAGDNNTTKTIDSSNGITFVPDLIWVKNRTVGVNHYLVDSVRGAGSGKHLHSNTTDSESSASTYATNGGIASFGSTEGFTVYKGSDATYQGTNKSGNNFVAWCWKAGGAPTTDNTATSGAMNANGSAATSSNSSVSIDGVLQSNYTPAGSPTIYPKRMSVNTKAGFSIVKYVGNGSAGQTIPHGLTKIPEFYTWKRLDDTSQWAVHTTAVDGSIDYVALNETSQKTDVDAAYLPTLNTVYISAAGSGVNVSNADYIVYCWHSVAGYSAFGSYTGNGSADGPFVYTGFKPAWVMVKNVTAQSSSTYTNYASWYIADSSRSPFNPSGNDNTLYANRSNEEGFRGNGSDSNNGSISLQIDFVSNGFKVRAGASVELGQDGSTFIYAAFAEQPFKYANAR